MLLKNMMMTINMPENICVDFTRLKWFDFKNSTMSLKSLSFLLRWLISFTNSEQSPDNCDRLLIVAEFFKSSNASRGCDVSSIPISLSLSSAVTTQYFTNLPKDEITGRTHRLTSTASKEFFPGPTYTEFTVYVVVERPGILGRTETLRWHLCVLYVENIPQSTSQTT